MDNINTKKFTDFKNLIPKMHHVKHIHFVGIGGSGMSGIAEILINEGYQISGSDLISNTVTQHLKKLGVTIFFNHNPKNINKANVVIMSSAINVNNVEIIAAQKACIPVIKRAEMLAELMRFRYGIAIAGTHGKTTTTAILSSIYVEAGLDPTFIIGGILKNTGICAKFGYSRYFIVEADESDASFLYLKPIIIIITNIESDHISNYKGDFEILKQAFVDFLHNLPFYGKAIICIDDPVIRELLPLINRQIITYGFNKIADLKIINLSQKKYHTIFTLYKKNKLKLRIKLNVPGKHNVLNAVAAITAAIENKIDNAIILKAIDKFQGTSRRFDNLGNYDLKNFNDRIGKIMLIDDYGHHPTELNVTIKTIRTNWPNKRLIMIFEPHRFTRIRDFYDDFVNVLSNVDILLMLEVYPAGEVLIPGASSSSLCHSINKFGKIKPILVLDINLLPKILSCLLKNNDILLIQGAGSISEVPRNLIRCFTKKFLNYNSLLILKNNL